MADSVYPQNYQDFNDYQTKFLNVVVCIEGLDYCFGLVPTYKKIRYGDPDLLYGDPGIVYGGLKVLDGVKPWLSAESSLTLSQKLEPEQGRGSVSTLTLVFVDKDGYFSRLCSPGAVLNDPLGDKLVTVRLGYANTSYPEDYFVVFRGYISKTVLQASKVRIELSDANLKRRSNIFFTSQTKLTAGIDAVTLSLPVVKTDRFFDQILGPDATYDPAVKTLVRIEDELIEYGPGGLAPTSITATSRGALGTVAAAHAVDADVTAVVQITDNLMLMALKLMLSGWNGPWLDDAAVEAFVQTNDPLLGNVFNAIIMPVDVVEEYGLAAGDSFSISGSGVGNNLSGFITGFDDVNGLPNRLIYTDQTFVTEFPATGATMAVRSKYDTYPVECGMGMRARDVDVATHEELYQNFFSQAENTFQFLIEEQETGKEFIEKELFLPVGAYSLTRFGRISAVTTKPPVANQRLVFLNKENILQPENIVITRGLNVRRFFNEIQYTYDRKDPEDKYSSKLVLLDTDSLNVIGQSSVMPIQAKGMRTFYNAETLINRRGNYLLSRYKDAAFEISMTVNWEAGGLIEAGDVVAISDNGELKIANLSTGERDLETQLFEVIERTMDLKSGTVKLTLLSNVGYQANDRFATISPSSDVVAGGTTMRIPITESYGNTSNEWKKWEEFVGLPIQVHDYDWTYYYESTLVGFDPVDPNILLVSPALGAAPVAGDIVDIVPYPATDPDPNTNQLYKLLHAHLSPSIAVVSGTSQTVFDVSLSDAAVMNEGQLILVHNDDYTVFSPEVEVQSIVGTTITVTDPLGFTPALGQTVELVGFKDGGGPYRVL